MSVSRMTSLLTVALAACLFDGEGTKGLPCNVDADCGAQRCVEGTCGGADAATTGTGEESGEESTGEPVDEQQLPEPCEDGHMACLGSNAMEICEDGKLHQFQCEWWCGMGNAVEGGCQADPRDGHEECWCASSGGPPSGTCENTCSSSSDCSSGESCLDTSVGRRCLPAECGGCFVGGQSCSWYTGSCKFAQCE